MGHTGTRANTRESRVNTTRVRPSRPILGLRWKLGIHGCRHCGRVGRTGGDKESDTEAHQFICTAPDVFGTLRSSFD